MQNTMIARLYEIILNPNLGRVPTPPYGYEPTKVQPREGIFIGIGSILTPPYDYQHPSNVVTEPRISSGELGEVLTRIDNAMFAGHVEWVDPNAVVNLEHDNTLTGTGSTIQPLSVALVDGGIF